MNAGEQDIDLRKPDEIFAAGDARDIDGGGQIIGGELIGRMSIDPQAQST